MKKKNRVLSLGLAAVMLGTLAAGCGNTGGSGNKGDVQVRLLSGWTSAGEDVNPDSLMYNKLIEEFNAEDNGVTIINEASSGDDKRNKARLDVTAGNACDIWHFWGGSTLHDYIKEGVLADMDEYLPESKLLSYEDIPETYWDFNRVDGKVYGVPFTQAISVFMVNKEIFEKYGQAYPANMEELKAVSKVFSDAGIASTNIGSKGGNPSHFFYSDLVCQYEGGQKGIEDMLGNYNFNTPQNRKALEIAEDLAKSKVFPSDTMANGDWSPSFELFTQGKAAMCYTFNWQFNQFPEDMLDKIEIIGVPAVSDSELSPQTHQQGWINDSNVILKKSLDDPKKHDAVIKAFDFVNVELSKAGAESGALVSPNTKITEQIDYTSEGMGLLGKVMQWRTDNNIEGRPNHWANCPSGDLQAYYQSTLDELWAGSISAKEAMEKIQKRFDQEKKK